MAQQEGSAWNGHFGCTCYHPLFVFNQFGDLERCVLRPGNVHSAEGWRSVLEPVIARYRERGLPTLLPRRRGVRQARAVRAAGGGGHRLRHPPAGQRGPAGADRPPADPARRPPAEEAAGVLRQLQLPGAELGQAAPGGGQGRVAPGRAVPARRLHRHQPDAAGRAGQQVLQRPRHRRAVDQGGQEALRWTRLSCHAFRHNAVRLQLSPWPTTSPTSCARWPCRRRSSSGR